MSDKHNNQVNRFEPSKNNRLNQHEATLVREVVGTVDSATGIMFGIASRYQVPHHEFNPNPAIMSVSAVAAEATMHLGGHDDFGMTDIQRTAEIDQLDAAFDAPAATDPQQDVNETDLDIAAIRARIDEVSSNA